MTASDALPGRRSSFRHSQFLERIILLGSAHHRHGIAFRKTEFGTWIGVEHAVSDYSHQRGAGVCAHGQLANGAAIEGTDRLQRVPVELQQTPGAPKKSDLLNVLDPFVRAERTARGAPCPYT